MKPGYLSTEFWAANAAAVAFIEAAKALANPWVQGLCIVVGGACVVAYVWTRGQAKCRHIENSKRRDLE